MQRTHNWGLRPFGELNLTDFDEGPYFLVEEGFLVQIHAGNMMKDSSSKVTRAI